MIASECCGSCISAKVLDRLKVESGFDLKCFESKVQSVNVNWVCKKYVPRVPIESKHEKMWNELKNRMELLESKSYKKIALDTIKRIEKKHKKG